MHVTRHLANCSGVTLVELLVVTALIGLLGELVALNLVSQMPKIRLNGATRQVMADLMAARMKAVMQSKTLKVTFPNTHEYLIWHDTDDDNSVGAGETIATSENILEKYHYVTFAAPLPAPFTFLSMGTASLSQNIHLTNGSASTSITVVISGKVKIN